MFRVILVYEGAPATAGDVAAREIQEHFATERRHHVNVTCVFASGVLTLTAENDYDADGSALMDEFSDCLSAFIEPLDGELRVVSVVRL